MGSKSRIAWTDASWNPTTGCTKVSQGCKNCYAARDARRLRGLYGYPEDDPFRLTLHPDRLELPLHWRRPRRIFVDSMSDLFHPNVPFKFIEQVFEVMHEAHWHTFQLLTKRPERMAEFMAWYANRCSDDGVGLRWTPDSHVWIGTSVEDQAAADTRIPHLLQCPAAVRFLSCEPLLGPVDLRMVDVGVRHANGYGPRRIVLDALSGWESQYRPKGGSDPDAWISHPDERVHWVIAGGESGPGARPCDPDWIRSLRDQCQSAKTPVFVKQFGTVWAKATGADPKGGDPSQWPEDLRVREMPATATAAGGHQIGTVS